MITHIIWSYIQTYFSRKNSNPNYVTDTKLTIDEIFELSCY